MEIGWSDPLDLGGTSLESYIIEMNGGSSGNANDWRIVQIQADAAVDKFYTETYLNNLDIYTNLVTGDIYGFRVTAKNIVGSSVTKATLQAMAATVPLSPSTPTRKFSSETSITI